MRAMFAPVRALSLKLLPASVSDRATERERTRANAEPCHSCHGSTRSSQLPSLSCVSTLAQASEVGAQALSYPSCWSMHRAVIVGTSGAGKSTVARALSGIYGLPHIDLDDLTTGTYPPVTGESFVRRVREVLAQPDWIIDDDYQRMLGDVVLSLADVAVWLDLPLRVSLARMGRRTSQAVRTGELKVHVGLIGWVAHEIRSHIRRRVTMRRRLAAHPSLRVVHLRSQQQVDAWLASQPSSQLG
jgi:adenylate kinase family enzyme